MARRRAAREGPDDDHAAAATWTCRLVVIRSIGIGRFALRLWPSEQFADARDVVGGAARRQPGRWNTRAQQPAMPVTNYLASSREAGDKANL
jgi:hypothetical protein